MMYLVYDSCSSTTQQPSSSVVEPCLQESSWKWQATRQDNLLIKVEGEIKVEGDVVTKLIDSIQCCENDVIVYDVIMYINIT